MNNFINAEILQLTLGTKLIFINLKLLSLSPTCFLLLQEIKNKQNGSELYLTKSSHRMSLEAFQMWLWWGQCHALRNQGFVCASVSPWAITASDVNDTKMHLLSLVFWLTQWSSNQTEAETFMRESHEGQKTQKYIIYCTCSLFSLHG